MRPSDNGVLACQILRGSAGSYLNQEESTGRSAQPRRVTRPWALHLAAMTRRDKTRRGHDKITTYVAMVEVDTGSRNGSMLPGFLAEL
jgi:hypothetical protein